MLKTYRASCHCGKVVVEASLDLEQSSYRCNCSICRRNRFWPAVAMPEHFRIVSGKDELTGMCSAGRRTTIISAGTAA